MAAIESIRQYRAPVAMSIRPAVAAAHTSSDPIGKHNMGSAERIAQKSRAGLSGGRNVEKHTVVADHTVIVYRARSTPDAPEKTQKIDIPLGTHVDIKA